MNIALIIGAALSALALWFLWHCAAKKAQDERWWRCAWCGCYFNEGKDVSNVPPLTPIKSDGCCAACKANTLKEYQMQRALRMEVGK